MSLYGCVFLALRFCLALLSSFYLWRVGVTFLQKLEKERLWRTHVALVLEEVLLMRTCQASKTSRTKILLLNSRNYISVFFPHLKCAITCLKLFRMVLANLRESRKLTHLGPELEMFDFTCLYKASTEAKRLLLAKTLLKHLEHSLDN